MTTALVYDSDVAPENLAPLEELKRLEERLEHARTLEDLQPLFGRAEEISQKHSANFDVQLAAHELKQRILAFGAKLRQAPSAAPPPPVPPKPPGIVKRDEVTQDEPIVPMPPAVPPPPSRMPPKPPLTQAPPPQQEQPRPTAKVAPIKGQPHPHPQIEEPQKKRGGIVIAWLLASLIALAGAGIAVSVLRDRGDRAAATTTLVDVHIGTTPTGASILINDQQTCMSDCVAKLLPGSYRVAAILDGYEAGTAQLTVAADEGASLDLRLQPQAPRVRVVAELRQGQVFLDDKLAGDLQDGSFTIEQVTPGTHKLRVVGGGSEASLQFAAQPGALPTIDGPIATKDVLAAIVSSAGGQARMVTSSGPLKLSVNGTEQAPATTEGVDLQGYRTGTDQFVLSQTNKDHTLSETFGAGAGLTVFLQSDQDIGTLVIATGQDDVRVFVNDRESKRRTQHGELRLQIIGKVNVRVAKDGFEEVPAQVATVEKGRETRLTFAMKQLSPFGIMLITGATPGAEVVLDQRTIGSIAADGTFRNSSVPPGDRTIELRRDQYEPKRLTRTFKAGQTVTIAGSEAALTAARAAPPSAPPPATVKPPSETVAKAPPIPPPAKASGGDMSNFDTPSAWREEDGIWHHRGAATLTYGLKPNGVFTFSIYMFRGGNIFRGGRVRWVLNYTGPNNYALFELDEDTFWAKTVTNGKTVERKKVAHKEDKDKRVWNIQIDISPSHMIHKIQGDSGWVEIDNWSDPSRDFTQGKFGFLVNGNDEIGVSNFHFAGR
jgi:hypothetical protein